MLLQLWCLCCCRWLPVPAELVCPSSCLPQAAPPARYLSLHGTSPSRRVAVSLPRPVQVLKTEFDSARILYNRFVSAIAQKPTIATVLSPDVSAWLLAGCVLVLLLLMHPASCRCAGCAQRVVLTAGCRMRCWGVQALERTAEAGAAIDQYEIEGPDRAELLMDLAEFQLAAVSRPALCTR